MEIQTEEFNAMLIPDLNILQDQQMPDVTALVQQENSDQIQESINENPQAEVALRPESANMDPDCAAIDEPINENIQVGMMLLPETLDIDPGLAATKKITHIQAHNHKQSADGVRIWVKHFSPLCLENGIQIPNAWCDFFTMSLMNPSRFEWAKSFLTPNDVS
jgi:hypothetical protein